MSTYISETLKNQIASTDFSRCCYCLTTEANSGIPMTYDRIRPVSKNGETSFDNLCLACRTCNEFKGDATFCVDPLLGETVASCYDKEQSFYSITNYLGFLDRVLIYSQSQF